MPNKNMGFLCCLSLLGGMWCYILNILREWLTDLKSLIPQGCTVAICWKMYWFKEHYTRNYTLLQSTDPHIYIYIACKYYIYEAW